MTSPFRSAASNGRSPFRSQKAEVVISSPSKNADQLPTPAASSQVEVDKELGNHNLDHIVDRSLMLMLL